MRRDSGKKKQSRNNDDREDDEEGPDAAVGAATPKRARPVWGKEEECGAGKLCNTLQNALFRDGLCPQITRYSQQTRRVVTNFAVVHTRFVHSEGLWNIKRCSLCSHNIYIYIAHIVFKTTINSNITSSYYRGDATTTTSTADREKVARRRGGEVVGLRTEED